MVISLEQQNASQSFDKGDKGTQEHLPSYLSEAKERRGGTFRLSRDVTGWSFHRDNLG